MRFPRKDDAQVELTEEPYWSDVWRSTEHYPPIHPRRGEYMDREFHGFFAVALAGRTGSLLEVGCGSSRWLPYFAREFGFQVSGIDYSEIGCQQASAILRRAGLEGVVLYRDALAENADLLDRYDVVVSLGLVEHFADTAKVLRSLARYVKPGGLLISTSPNMAGILGAAQKMLNRKVYDGHIPFTLEELVGAHRKAGLAIAEAAYIGGLDFHTLNLHGTSAQARRLVYRVLLRLSRIGWKAPFSVPRSRRWSSALAVSAAKSA